MPLSLSSLWATFWPTESPGPLQVCPYTIVPVEWRRAPTLNKYGKKLKKIIIIRQTNKQENKRRLDLKSANLEKTESTPNNEIKSSVY